MATLTSLGTISINGLKQNALAAATAGGDDFVNTGACLLVLANANVGAVRTVTIHMEALCSTGLVQHDIDVIIPISGTKYVYALSPTLFNNSTGKVSLTYSDAGADITVGYFKI